MVGFNQAVRKLFGRGSRQQVIALRQMTEGKTVRHRVAGFAKSERVDAKFFLLAMVPFVPLIVFDEIGWSREVIWHVWFGLSIIWAAVIVGIGFAPYWRAFRRSLDRNR